MYIKIQKSILSFLFSKKKKQCTKQIFCLFVLFYILDSSVDICSSIVEGTAFPQAALFFRFFGQN